MIALILLPVATSLGVILAGYLWHAGRPQQPSNVIELAQAKARCEEAKRVARADRKTIHSGAAS